MKNSPAWQERPGSRRGLVAEAGGGCPAEFSLRKQREMNDSTQLLPPCFYPVQNPSLWSGAAYISGQSSHLSVESLS